jgi:hypothetical protein
LDPIAPSQTRLFLAQANPGAAAAVSSQAVATQPGDPTRADEAKPPQALHPTPISTNTPAEPAKILDPRLDPNRPRDCQLMVETEQTVTCGNILVVLPAGTYQQIEMMENPEGRRAISNTSLKPQQIGLGYIRYLSDVRLKVNGVERTGGIDVPVRQEDNLPIRIWYRKMTEPDDITKAFTFILPPVALVAGAGAWSSGNTLLPDSPPAFTEYRDYFLKPPSSSLTPAGAAKPAHPGAESLTDTHTPKPAGRKPSGFRTP